MTGILIKYKTVISIENLTINFIEYVTVIVIDCITVMLTGMQCKNEQKYLNI